MQKNLVFGVFCFKWLWATELKAFEGSKKKQATKLMLSVDFLKDSVQIRIASAVVKDVLKSN